MRCKELISTFTMEAGLVIAALMAVVGVVQWKRQSGRQQQEKYILDYAGQVSELESQKREEERQQRQEEEKKQKDRLFGMDFMITHGSAFSVEQLVLCWLIYVQYYHQVLSLILLPVLL